MHTGNAPEVIVGQDGTKYEWVAAWGASSVLDMEPITMYTGSDHQTCTLDVVTFIGAIRKAAASLFTQARNNPEVQKNVLLHWKQSIAHNQRLDK
jgi:hypothetical protein